MSLYLIIKNTVAKLHKEIAVINQTDNNGIATIELLYIWLIRKGQYILGSDDKKYKIIEVSGNEIKIKNPYIITFTTVKNLSPFFFAGQFIEYSNHLTGENYTKQEDREKYPSIFLETEYTENNSSNLYYISDISILFNNYNDIDLLDLTIENEIKYLELLKKEFLKQLIKNVDVIDFTENHKSVPKANFLTNNKINRLHLSLNIQYFETNCN